MKAVVYDRYGSPEVLRYCEIEKPVPGKDDVVVRVASVSLNMSDWEILHGTPLYARIFGLRRPKHRSLGSDVTGTVESVGQNVTSLKPGDEVYGDTMGSFGGFAEYARVPARALVKKPSGLSFEAASTIPQAAIIAWQGLRQAGGIRPGQQVLINGGGGGSGMFAIQLAKMWGAEVTAVDNEGKLEHMRKLGADHVIDYEADDYARMERRYDLVLDLVGTRSVFAHRRAVKRGGCYVMVGGSMNSMLQTLLLGPIVGAATGAKLGILAANPNEEDFGAIVDLLGSGDLTLSIERRYTLPEVPEALRHLGEGHALGKLVVNVSESGSSPR